MCLEHPLKHTHLNGNLSLFLKKKNFVDQNCQINTCGNLVSVVICDV